MAKLDEIKEFIGFLKAVFITAILIMSSLVAYLYQKPLEENYTVLVAICVDAIMISLLLKKILKEIKSLKDL